MSSLKEYRGLLGLMFRIRTFCNPVWSVSKQRHTLWVPMESTSLKQKHMKQNKTETKEGTYHFGRVVEVHWVK
jgi:hypothetical protein